MAVRKDDDVEPSPEEARALLVKLLRDAGAEVDPATLEAEKQAEAKAAADGVEARKNTKPLLGFDTKRNDPPMPAVGRAPRKKT